MPVHAQLKILFCHFTSDVAGGSDRSLFDLVTHLPREKFTPVMLLKKGDPLAPDYRKSGIKVYEITLVSPRRAPDPIKLLRFLLYFFPSVLRIVQIIRREKVQVVHVNTLFNLQGALAARMAGRPLVWHIRELLPDSRVVGFFLNCVQRWATRVIPNSHAVAESVAACGSRVKVVHNGIDLSEYENPADGEAVRLELGCTRDDKFVCVIGRLEPWKGQHVVVEAFPVILAAHPNTRLYLVGGPAVNKPEYLAALEERVAELGIPERVSFTGIRHDIPAVLAACDVLILPSVTPEPFGRTLVEAMAAARPVIATKQGGPLEIVLDGETGLLVPPEDPKCLAEACTTLLKDPALAGRMGAAGRERAFAKFSLDRVVAEVGEILHDAAQA